MIIVDAHCDTITKLMETGEELFKNSCHNDIVRQNEYKGYLQFFAAFIDPEFRSKPLKRTMQIIDKFYIELQKNTDDMSLCLNFKDVENTFSKKKIAAFLSIEGGEALEGDISSLRMLYKLGVRSICLTWNHRNEIADGVGEEITNGGLTLFGREVVSEMNRLGMLIDVSHIAEKGFWDVIHQSTKPIIASHSNARKICSHRRNLWDEQILALEKNGGVMGVNFYPPFLSGNRNASLSDVISHIEYISSLVGCDHIGIGADFDGIEQCPKDLEGVQDTYKIFEELARMNYKEEDIKKIAGGNFLRVIKEVC